VAEERSPSQLEHWFSLGASIVAPVTVISALLFYFGYVSSRAQYEYFGIDVDTIGLSTQDYVMRSGQSLLVPLLALVVIGLALVVAHLWITARMQAAEPATVLPTARRVLAAGLVVFVAGMVLIGLYPVLGEWPYYPLVTPVVVAVGAGVVAYTWRLVASLSVAEDRDKPPARSPTLRRMGLVLLCFLVVATVFWSTATIAQIAGRGLARSTARHLHDLPIVILDTKERLFLYDPGVKETALTPTTEGQTFHYRYRNLHLLIQGNNRMFLVPPVWSASDTVLVVPLDGSVRVRFQFTNHAPPP
jgi:hypothetical protein